ncbi:PAS domain S-box protein [Bradyrhizobium erythrophlei]|uniref:histidine kinase n=1 Tax=Bradyrhizobium erythrophlei TaxID=1437360 RepID=A0A1M7TFX7_9BRAD|nr:PAS domain S-box protein [Bradyrhizobium erythrophlei]SHN69669.1 PAS/PAC sensor signal transduction histidine kinase [Bradyrhizobium erythrophlei]
MQSSEFKARGPDDPRLAVHATSPLPAWLWSVDGTRVLWANPAGALAFGATNGVRLAGKIFGPADSHRRQIAQLAHRLLPNGAVRLERLRGFGSVLNTLVTCACARLEFADGHDGVLIVATDPLSRTMPLTERLEKLVEEVDAPVATFESDGTRVAASARADFYGLHHLADAGLEEARQIALRDGRAEAPLGSARITLTRLGDRTDTGLLAVITPAEIPAVADELPTAVFSDAVADDAAAEMPNTAGNADAVSQGDATEAAPRAADPQPAEPLAQTPFRYPMRFMWQMDAEGRFSLGSDAFTRLIGVHTAAGFGRPWTEIAQVFGLDPEGLVVKAIATRESWSGIIVDWPAGDGSRLPVELSGLPIHDAGQNFVGYRGFGVCRDVEGLSRLDVLRSQEFFNDPPSADMMSPEIGQALAGTWKSPAPPSHIADTSVNSTAPISSAPLPDTSPSTDQETPVDTPNDLQEVPAISPNVVPFRPLTEARAPVLTPVENSAFDELARQLSARLETDDDAPEGSESSEAPQSVAAPSVQVETTEPPAPPPTWLAEPEPPARGESKRDKTLLDLLPTGVMIYRLDRLLYANPAFLERMGYASLHALEQAGGVDALYVEPGVSSASSTSDTGTPVRISSPEAPSAGTVDARLHTISWDNESAHALMFAGAFTENVVATPVVVPPPTPPAPEPPAVGQVNAEELAAILDTSADGILMFDALGNIHSCNRSAEALFGYDGAELTQLNLTTLFAPESEGVVKQYLESVGGTDIASLLEHGNEIFGRRRSGDHVPLSMTIGRTQANGPNFFAAFRDLSQIKKGENELREAQRIADRTATAKADLLARISHEIRTPLNAIIGFAEVMISERFGALGNDRYIEYMKDVRTSGQRVVAVLDDMTDLSRIETGKLDLAFTSQNLNDLVESCVAVMQPQASRERIIIRTSLAHMLPPVVADGPALRQITMNLIGNSIHLTNAGGQVIVSTALTDFGDVALRIRDSGPGLNDNEVAAAMEPFRQQAPFDQSPEAAVSLSLTKALVEANRAQFNIKTGARSGTLVEVVFSRAIAKT